MHFPSIEDRYEIIEQIGRGGMGNVYKAFDTQIEREVAIKFLNIAHLSDDISNQRFQREVQTLAQITHTAIVPLYDYGGLDRQISSIPPFIVMRMMDRPLSDVIVRGVPMSFPAAVHILDRVGSALDVVHKRNIVHRDLKPQNIFLDSHNYSYLGDFGIAYQADLQTLSGDALIGTPHYMSPEQIKAKSLNGRSDIYSLGCVLFELLSGRRPFQYESSHHQIFEAHLVASRPSIDSFGHDLPPGINDVIHKAMAINPEERYPSAGAMVNHLKQLANGPLISINDSPTSFYSSFSQTDTFDTILHEEPNPEHEDTETFQPEGWPANLFYWAAFAFGFAILAFVAYLVVQARKVQEPELTPDPVTPVTVEGPVTLEEPATFLIPTSTETPTATATPTATPFPTPTPQFLVVPVYGDTAVWIDRGNVERIPNNGIIPLSADSIIQLNSNLDSIHLSSLNNNSFIISKLSKLFIQEGNFRLLHGSLIMDQVAEQDQITIETLNTSFETQVKKGTMGVRFDEGTNIIRIDCAAEKCLFRRDGVLLFILTGDEAVQNRIDLLEAKPTILPSNFSDYPNETSLSEILTESQGAGTVIPTVSLFPSSQPATGNIIYTCFVDSIDQICRLNLNSLIERQLTFEPATSFYSSPDFTGGIITFSSRRDGQFRLYQTDINGEGQRLLGDQQINTFGPEISPFRDKVVYALTETSNGHIWIYDLNTGLNSQLTVGNQTDQDPSWSTDGSKIAFVSNRTGQKEHYIMNPDGTDLTQIKYDLPNKGGRSDLSPDGNWLAVFAGEQNRRNIYLVSLNDGKTVQLTQSGDNLAPSFSPDGQWVVFSSVRNGDSDSELYMIRSNGTDLTRLTDNNRSDWQPRWGP